MRRHMENIIIAVLATASFIVVVYLLVTKPPKKSSRNWCSTITHVDVYGEHCKWGKP